MIAEIENATESKSATIEIELTTKGPPPAVKTGAESPILSRLLKMAESYFANQAIHQAIEIFFELVEQHPDTPEAERARSRLIAICEEFERQGKPHQARSLYERLL